MIGRLTGKLIELDANTLLVDVAGVGYEVEVSAAVLGMLPGGDEKFTLHTHFVVREDAQLLYGFAAKNERELFRAFIKISGVGPKLGLALISALDPHALVVAVRNNDISLLTKVPGVGKKTAERLMVELKSRIDALAQSGAVPLNVLSGDNLSSPRAPLMAVEAEDALIALGYRPQEAHRAVSKALQSVVEEDISAAALVRLALRGFAPSSSTT